MYGYEMTKEVERMSDGIFTFKEGTLYPILHTLEVENYVEAYWNEEGGRKRLGEKQKEWSLFRTTVDRVLWEGQAWAIV